MPIPRSKRTAWWRAPTELQSAQYRTAVSHVATRRDIAALPGVKVSKVPVPKAVPHPFRVKKGQLLWGLAKEGEWTKVSAGARFGRRGLPDIERHEAAHHVLWQRKVPTAVHEKAIESARTGPKAPLSFRLLKPAAAAAQKETPTTKLGLASAKVQERFPTETQKKLRKVGQWARKRR